MRPRTKSGDTGKETKSDVDLPVVPLIIVAPEPEPPFEVKHEAVDFIVDGTKVIGTLALPVGKSPAPVVLLLHGYTGSCSNDDVAGTGEKLFGRVQRLWAVQGYASSVHRLSRFGAGVQTTAFPWADYDVRVARSPRRGQGRFVSRKFRQTRQRQADRRCWLEPGRADSGRSRRTEHRI